MIPRPVILYIEAVAIGIDVTANAILGGRKYQTISSRIGESIKTGGWASRVRWPKPFLDHFLGSDYSTEV